MTEETTVPEGAERFPLRTGGWAAIADDALYVATDEQRVRVPFDDVHEAMLEDYDYFLGVLSLVLIGFGLWFAQRNPLALLFSLAGVGSLYLVYQRRGELTIRATGRAKPLTIYPADAASLYAVLADRAGRPVDGDADHPGEGER